ncbi:MAG: type II secretion system protein GspD [Verrucomicrobia bacterium]|nr:type II secretion system protein GspD [Verrucomicrobiota bacterium]
MIKRLTKHKHLLTCSALIGLLFASYPNPLLLAEEEERVEAVETPQSIQEGYSINFNDVPVIEFIRFVSKISEENFIFDNQDMRFKVSLSTGKPVSPAKVVQALIQLLKVHGFVVSRESDYYVVHKGTEEELARPENFHSGRTIDGLIASAAANIPLPAKESYEFFSYKIQYHEGVELEESLKKIAADLKNQPDAPAKLINALQSLQWVKATNSLLCSADPDTLEKLRRLIETVDVPLRQVFIEVLVIETDVKKNMEFGLQWAAGGQYRNQMGFGMGNFQPHHNGPGSFAGTMQGINASNTPTGLNQIPLVPGFDLGVIGDIIMHKGRSYLSLGSLVSALQMDGDSTIVLNQKIITQDNKNSTIFVGDNIPFTGSVVQTVGQSQQTTANIEYRDIGVSLSITPRLGEGDVITLDLNEEITESLDHELPNNNASVNGIRTTKTNMVTHVHVPDKNFLVLSGMIRNTKARHKAGLPCLGGLPWIGAAFSKTRQHDEKRNVVIFVRPHIIRSFEDYQKVTRGQQQAFESQANKKDFAEAIDILPKDD